MRASLSLLTLCALLAACGQRGDLYIPEPTREAVTAPATGASTDADSDAEAEERRRQQNAAGTD